MENSLSKTVSDFRKKELGQTQGAFAKNVGISIPTLRGVERGLSPSEGTYKKLADFMGLDPKELRVLKTKE